MTAQGRFQLVPVVQCRRRSQNLQAAQNRMADDMHQRHNAKTTADFGENDPRLRHRSVGQHALEIGLHASDCTGMQGSAQTNHHQHHPGQQRCIEQRLAPQKHIGPSMN